MKRIKIVLIFCFCFTLLGCAAVSKAVDRYKACKGDPVCVQEMESVRQASYVVSKSAAGPMLPSMSEVIAVLVSNVVSFGFGVFHGGKKKGG